MHSPGQKIIYFVINLNNRKKDIRKLINAIELSIIEFLKILKIVAKKDKKNIGIWVKEKKIAGREGIFSGGFDLKTLASGDVDAIIKMVSLGNKTLLDLYSFPRPIVNGDLYDCYA